MNKKLIEDRFGAKTDDNVAGYIYQTKNYQQFHFDKLNRKISNIAVNKLVNAIKAGEAKTQPIQIAPDFTIVDGQHRFVALRKMGRPIYYYIDRLSHGLDAATQNSKQKHWRLIDFVNSYINSGNQDYRRLKELWGRFQSTVSLSSTALLLSDKKACSHTTAADIKSGNFKINNPDDTTDYLVFLKEVATKNHQRKAFPRPQVIAIHRFFVNQNVSRKRLSQVLTKELVDNFPSEEMPIMRQIGEAYNYRLSKGSINYVIDNRGHFSFTD